MPANDCVVSGKAFAAAVRRVLPRSPTKDLGGVVVEAGAAGTLRITSFFATAEIPIVGEWHEVVEVSGRLLRNLVKGEAAAEVRIVYVDGVLRLGHTAITVAPRAGAGDVRKPRSIPTNRLGR